jgi:hypothetical protein
MSVESENIWDGSGMKAAKAFERKRAEWRQRDWMTWLAGNLAFPFTVTRMEDRHLHEGDAENPFRLGHTMRVLGLELEDDLYGVIVKVREKRPVGAVPLCDVEVEPKTDKNYWPVREYVVWFANR